MISMFGSFPPSPLLVWHHKVYSGLGADIVMESLHSSLRFSQELIGIRTNPVSRALVVHRVDHWCTTAVHFGTTGHHHRR
jgi:hypothetical protein